MKYLEIIEDKFKLDIKHYKKLVSKAFTNNKDLEELIKNLNNVVDFYIKNIRNDDYILTSQDIVEHLSLSRHFVDKNIIPFLDKLYLPTSKEGLELFKKIFYTKIEKLIVVNQSHRIKLHIEKLLHGKVLISKKSYIKYLNKIVTVDNSFTMINIEFTTDELTKIYSKYDSKFKENITERGFIEKLFNDFKTFNPIAKNKEDKDIKINFESVCNNKFNIFNNNLSNLKEELIFNILSIDTMKEIYKENENINVGTAISNALTLKLNFEKSKSITRYYLGSNLFNIKKEKNNKHYFQVSIKTNAFINIYNMSNKKVSTEFIKYLL